MTSERRRLGERGEDAAVAFLERCGFTIVARNWVGRSGEVDIVALDGEQLVLCEVKTRKSVAKGTPADAVNPAKQRRYSRLAAEYLQHTGATDTALRFDVITILVIAPDRALLRHHRDAFSVPDTSA